MPDTLISLNPFSEQLRQLEAKIVDLTQQNKAIAEELRWFNSNNEAELKNKLGACRQQVDKLRRKQEGKEKEISLCQQKRSDIKAKTRTIFNPKNWFSSDQVNLRRTQKELKHTQQTIEEEKECLLNQIGKVEPNVVTAEKESERYTSFDRSACNTDLSRIETELASFKLKAKQIAERKAAVDKRLKPVVDQIHQYIESKQRTEAMLDRATSLDQELSNADNSYEKAMIHKLCETEFNVGSPRKVIGKAERELRRIARDSEKAYKRAFEIGQKAARRIDAVVIDGMNLCYDNNGFIGLSALEALIPIMQDDYKVTVVFDAAIRKMAKSNDQVISTHLGDQIQVHVVATKGKADETVLDLAGSDKYTYILSNDRFGEYNEKRAIRDNRVLRHEIVNGRIMVHDLGVNAKY